jgi:hypothetical protein
LVDGERVVMIPPGHAYVFLGCHDGVLHAHATCPPTLENVMGASWELASWARRRWQPVFEHDEDEIVRRRGDRLVRASWWMSVALVILGLVIHIIRR